jgi:aspartate ammonia-lyase
VLEKGMLSRKEIEKIFNPMAMTKPRIVKKYSGV